MPYLFGDSDPAAHRLEIVHQVFAATSRELLQRFANHNVDLAVDLGCGPGLSTQLLVESTQSQRAIGLDMSDRFIELANLRRLPGTEFVIHDVTVVPFPVQPVDLLYARLLVGERRRHLA